jgi:hypothetical protein
MPQPRRTFFLTGPQGPWPSMERSVICALGRVGRIRHERQWRLEAGVHHPAGRGSGRDRPRGTVCRRIIQCRSCGLCGIFIAPCVPHQPPTRLDMWSDWMIGTRRHDASVSENITFAACCLFANCHCVDGPGHGPKRYLVTISLADDRAEIMCRTPSASGSPD